MVNKFILHLLIVPAGSDVDRLWPVRARLLRIGPEGRAALPAAAEGTPGRLAAPQNLHATRCRISLKLHTAARFKAFQAGAAWLERELGGPWLSLHVAANVLFWCWAAWDIAFGHHNPHGPNSLFIIVPGYLALALFYGVAFRRVGCSAKVVGPRWQTWCGTAAVLNTLMFVWVWLG